MKRSRRAEAGARPRPSTLRGPLLAPAPLVVVVGEGGAGKTTCAAAAALAEARAGRSVLVASIDPAHSLGDALGHPLGHDPSPVEVAGATFDACELDGARAWSRWLDEHRATLRTALARGTWFGESELDGLLDLVPPGLDELMAWQELERLAASPRYERVFVDAAPAGQLLRLVDAPSVLARLADSLGALNEKHRVLARSLAGAEAPDGTADAIDELSDAAARLSALLRDPRRCSFVWVVTPGPTASSEVVDGAARLAALGLRVAAVVLQRHGVSGREACSRCDARARASQELESDLRARLGSVPVLSVPEFAREPRAGELRRVADALERPRPQRVRTPGARPAGALRPRRSRRTPTWLARLAPPGLRLLVLAGKGGVGKSTCAVALALELARSREHSGVLLLSVDPAHSLGDLLELDLDDGRRPVAERLEARELDASRAYCSRREAWKARLDEAFAERLGDGLDVRLDREALGALLDVSPPGLDQLAALLALLEELGLDPDAPGEPGRDDRLVVLDTPATGHALELLGLPDLALSWIREGLALLVEQPAELRPPGVAQGLLDGARSLRLLGALLRDPARTRCIAVTRAAELPRRETIRLVEALERLGLELAAVVVNAGSAPTEGCSRCRRLVADERSELGALDAALPERTRTGATRLWAPETFPAPRGAAQLADWARTWDRWPVEVPG